MKKANFPLHTIRHSRCKLQSSLARVCVSHRDAQISISETRTSHVLEQLLYRRCMMQPNGSVKTSNGSGRLCITSAPGYASRLEAWCDTAHSTILIQRRFLVFIAISAGCASPLFTQHSYTKLPSWRLPMPLLRATNSTRSPTSTGHLKMPGIAFQTGLSTFSVASMKKVRIQVEV